MNWAAQFTLVYHEALLSWDIYSKRDEASIRQALGRYTISFTTKLLLLSPHFFLFREALLSSLLTELDRRYDASTLFPFYKIASR